MKSKVFASLIALLLSVTMFAQNQITGVIKDNIGPLVGASVFEQGTKNGTVTDNDGRFILNVQTGSTIEVSDRKSVV